MSARRHRSFRPTLDVLPGRIAPSSSGTLAPDDLSTATPPPSSYDLLTNNSPTLTLASQSPAVDPPS